MITLWDGFSGENSAGPDFHAAPGGWLASRCQCGRAAAPPVAAAACQGGKASVCHPRGADPAHPAGQRNEGGEYRLFGVYQRRYDRSPLELICVRWKRTFLILVMHIASSQQQFDLFIY